MALSGSRPSWQTAELSEEWPMSSPSSASSASPHPDAISQQRVPPSGSTNRAPSTADRETNPQAPGTFLVRDDVKDTGLQGPLAKLRAAGGGGLSGPNSPGSRSLFSPMKLESMFQPPSPPQDSSSTSPKEQLLPEVILTPPQASSISTGRPPSSASPSPSPASASPSPLPRQGQHALHSQKQLYHVPPVPSRLQNTFTPADLTASTIDPRQDEQEQEETGAVVLDDGEHLALGTSQERDWPSNFHFQCRAGQPGGVLSPVQAAGTKLVAAHSTPSDKSTLSIRRDQDGSPTTYTRLSLHTSHAQNHGSARTAPSTVASSTAQPLDASGKKLNLFRPTYDTFTRDFMSAMVDTIESSPSSSSSDTPPRTTTTHQRAPSDRDAAVDFRDSKRIRLASPSSPPPAGTTSTRVVSGSSNSSFERLRRGKASSKSSREWDGEARQLMMRVREMGKSTSGRTAGGGARGFSASSRETWGRGESSFEGSEEGAEARRIDPIAEVPEAEGSPRPVRNAEPTSTQAAAPRPRTSAYVRESTNTFSKLQANPPSISGGSTAGDTVHTASWNSARTFSRTSREGKENAAPEGEEAFGDLRVKKQSPRKLLRRLSAADEVEKEMVEAEKSPTKSPLRASQATRPPPASSSGAAGIVPTADLNRYVSSSTMPASTIGQSTISSSSFTKHEGPPVHKSGGATKLTTIPYEDGATPIRVGKLEYDREKMKWVKIREGHSRAGSMGSKASEEEDDPFKDFNSTVASNKAGKVGGNLIEQLRASTSTPPLEEQTAFQRDPSRSLSLPRSFERSLSISSNHGGDGFDMDEVAASLKSFQFPSSSSSESLASPPAAKSRPLPQHHNSAPLPPVASTPLPSSQQRARVASTGGLRPCITPVSVLKKRSPGVGFRDAETPGSASHRRSVSFSDGKKTGKIDLQVDKIEFSLGGYRRSGEVDPDCSAAPSARAVRIQSMLDGLGDDEATETMASLAEETPSKGGSSLRHFKPRDPPRAAATAQEAEYDESDSTLGAFNMTARSIGAGRSFHYGGKRGAPGDATFLTECSFDGVRDRLVEIITDVHPYVAYWEDLRELNLEGRLAGSVARLKEFLPKLVEVNLTRNDLSYLSGLPATVETLHAAHNRLSELTAVAHLSNLRYLNIGFNQLEAVNQLDCLKNLTELHLDANSIIDLSPIFQLSNITSLSAAGNGISHLDVSTSRWPQLQSLDLSRNKLAVVAGLDRLSSLTTLNLDDNRLQAFNPPVDLRSLKTLKISGNSLRRLDVQAFPQLRTLYADNNELETINPAGSRTKLQTFSARSQRDSTLSITGRELREVKRLFLSGNQIPPSLFDHPCPHLAYLELASCKLSSLPVDLSRFAPHLKSLNLNYNYLLDLSSVSHLRKLRKLSVVGSRIEKPRSVVSVLQTLPSLEMFDLRMNPFTLAMYLPLIVGSMSATVDLASASSTVASVNPSSSAPSNNSAPWSELDAVFRRSLPDEWYVRRLAHRGLVMRVCPRIGTLDGVSIESGERSKAEELLLTLESRKE